MGSASGLAQFSPESPRVSGCGEGGHDASAGRTLFGFPVICRSPNPVSPRRIPIRLSPLHARLRSPVIAEFVRLPLRFVRRQTLRFRNPRRRMPAVRQAVASRLSLLGKRNRRVFRGGVIPRRGIGGSYLLHPPSSILHLRRLFRTGFGLVLYWFGTGSELCALNADIGSPRVRKQSGTVGLFRTLEALEVAYGPCGLGGVFHARDAVSRLQLAKKGLYVHVIDGENLRLPCERLPLKHAVIESLCP